MARTVAILGAGVSGLTCGVRFAECNWRTTILAENIGTTSLAAAAIWYPYDSGPVDRTIPWALETYDILRELSRDPRTGVSMIEVCQFRRTGEIEIPEWAVPLGAEPFFSGIPAAFSSGFRLRVPLMDTSVYLDYLDQRFRAAGGKLHLYCHVSKLEEIDAGFDLIIHCAGIGARTLVTDPDLEPHRGQIALVEKVNLPVAIVSDDPPLMYAIPRRLDCLFGGTNENSDNESVDPTTTIRLVEECSRVIGIDPPQVVGVRVGLRPFRRSGVRVERGDLPDGRPVIHNYGHGGSGFTLSWGCAETVLELAGAGC